jgi:glycosyltransferase involved in cell wall biosynthesis
LLKWGHDVIGHAGRFHRNQSKDDASLMRILYITKNSDRPESASIIGLRDAGVAPIVMGDLRSAHMQRIRDAGIAVLDVPLDKRLDRKAQQLIRETVVSHKIDIVHAFTNRTVLHMVLGTRGLPVKLVAYRGVIGNVSWLSPLSWMRFLNPRISRIICVAEKIRDYLLGLNFLWLRLNPDKVVTINKGHDLSWYSDDPVGLSNFGIPPDAMVVACSSRLRPRKGLWELVQALGLTDPQKNIHILFLGHEGNDSLRAEITKLAHPERVHFAGFRKDAPAIMAASDVCALPVLDGEGLSRAVIEAMAYGVPAIVTPVGGNTELIVDGECGLVVPVGDVPALAQAMEKLYDDPIQRQRFGEVARKRIANRFRKEDTVRKTMVLYAEILGE